MSKKTEEKINTIMLTIVFIMGWIFINACMMLTA